MHQQSEEGKIGKRCTSRGSRPTVQHGMHNVIAVCPSAFIRPYLQQRSPGQTASLTKEPHSGRIQEERARGGGSWGKIEEETRRDGVTEKRFM